MDNLTYKNDQERYKTTGERPLMFYKYKQTILCPFQNKLPILNKLTGQMQLEATPCNELCPQFELVESLNDMETDEEKFIDIRLNCGGNPKNIRLVVVQESSNKIASL